MNMRLIFPLVVALALVPMLATHRDFRPNLGVGSGYTSGWQVGAPDDSVEQSARFDCIAAGTDLLRRAAPPLNGGTGTSPWAHRSIGLAPAERFVCVNS